MFKQTFGFDVDVLCSGVPIYIHDRQANIKFTHRGIDFHGYNCEESSLSGTYIIKDSNPTMLILTSTFGKEVHIPIGHFVGDNPRMTIDVYKLKGEVI